MRRRLDLAGALVAEPPVLFLDEPTTGLDPRSRIELWDVIRELVGRGTTLLLTTQYLEEADQLADDIVVIDHGRAIAQGTADQLKAQVGGERIEVIVADPARSTAPGRCCARLRRRRRRGRRGDADAGRPDHRRGRARSTAALRRPRRRRRSRSPTSACAARPSTTCS